MAVGSILSSVDKVKFDDLSSTGGQTSEAETVTVREGWFKKSQKDVASATYEPLQKKMDQSMSKYLNNGIRLLGAPHQLLPQADPRYGNSELGRTFAKKMILEAPLVYLKPGVSEFLPGKSSGFRNQILDLIANVSDSEKQEELKHIFEEDGAEGRDSIRYYGIKPDFSGYMSHVNSLCRILAHLEGLDSVRVPWAKGNVKFSTYDWRYYNMESKYNNLKIKGGGNAFMNIFKDLQNSVNGITHDYEYIRFYATPESSYNHSFSNTTTTSVIENITSQLEGVARELNTIGAMSGTNINEGITAMTDVANQFVDEHGSNSAISTLIQRLTGSLDSVMLGGHIVLPEMWGGSSYDNDFSFSIHLSTPYGNKLSRYIHIGVPMMFILAAVLPIHQSPNVVSSPYLFQCFMPGYFDSDMCIISNVSIEKSTEGITMGNNIPSEVKINIGVKDLYSSLSLPKAHRFEDWVSNTGMMEFLAVQAGVDISKQGIADNFGMLLALMKDSFSDHIQDTAYELMMSFKHLAIDWFKMIN